MNAHAVNDADAQELGGNAFNYDTWFDYLRMMESDGSDRTQVRELYERAISNVPPSTVSSCGFLVGQLRLIVRRYQIDLHLFVSV